MLLLTLVWGSSFILIKKSLYVFLPRHIVLLRIIIAGLVLSWYVPRASTQVKGKDWLYLGVFASLTLLLPSILMVTAQVFIDSFVNGILNSLTPLMTLLVGVVLYRQPIRNPQIAGLLIGLVGTAFFMGALADHRFAGVNLYASMTVMATLFHALGLNVLQRYLSHLHPGVVATLAHILLLPVAVVLFVIGGGLMQDFHDVEVWRALMYLLVLGVVGNALGLTLYGQLVLFKGPVFASTVTYLMPIVILMWGLADAETVTLPQVLATVVIMVGVWLTGNGRTSHRGNSANKQPESAN
ncbi:MAG: DMT family transporter [Bacteroidia bacterium]|nr:DMT family transporter [Bacteroidia bacterium]